MASTTTTPAHRPSRRSDIIEAAVRQFARKGFVDAGIADVANDADVVATAVYYHFSGKEELFTAAVQYVFESITAVVSAVRDVGTASDIDTLDRAIDAVWQWIDDHPDEATLIHLQLPGATPQITTLRQEFEALHVQRAFGYLSPTTTRARPSAARRAVETLSVRTLVDLLIAVHTMRLADGPLSREKSGKLRAAVHDLSRRLVAID